MWHRTETKGFVLYFSFRPSRVRDEACCVVMKRSVWFRSGLWLAAIYGMWPLKHLGINSCFLLISLLTFQQPLLPFSPRHLAASSRSEEGSSGRWNVNRMLQFDEDICLIKLKFFLSFGYLLVKWINMPIPGKPVCRSKSKTNPSCFSASFCSVSHVQPALVQRRTFVVRPVITGTRGPGRMYKGNWSLIIIYWTKSYYRVYCITSLMREVGRRRDYVAAERDRWIVLKRGSHKCSETIFLYAVQVLCKCAQSCGELVGSFAAVVTKNSHCTCGNSIWCRATHRPKPRLNRRLCCR